MGNKPLKQLTLQTHLHKIEGYSLMLFAEPNLIYVTISFSVIWSNMGLILHKMTTLIPSAPLQSHGSTCQIEMDTKARIKRSQNWTTWRLKDCQRSAKSLAKDPKIIQGLQPHHCSLLWRASYKGLFINDVITFGGYSDPRPPCHHVIFRPGVYKITLWIIIILMYSDSYYDYKCYGV